MSLRSNVWVTPIEVDEWVTFVISGQRVRGKVLELPEGNNHHYRLGLYDEGRMWETAYISQYDYFIRDNT